jgi:tetratricopeptide (TPR) repeat protein
MEALPVWHIDLTIVEKENDWHNAATVATNLSECETHLGELTAALANAREAVTHARRTGEKRAISIARANLAASLHMIGQFGRAAQIFRNLERDEMPLVSMSGYSCCNLLIDKGNWEEVRKRAKIAIDIAQRGHWLADVGTATMTLGRSSFGLALQSVVKKKSSKVSESRASDAWTQLCQGVEGLRATGWDEYISRGLVARAAFHRGVGDWDGAARDLDEVEEIAEPGPMRLYLCDMALERARLAFAKFEAFAPLTGLLENDNPPRPTVPGAQQIAELKTETEKQLKIAAEYIEKCDYHRRDEALAELQAVLRGEKRFADLPPRV